jgi:group II intron reverse transcriptase/maturase
MQHKLATWTTDSQDRRIDRLLRLVAHPDWLAEAARITLSSAGAKTPGVDGITKQQLQASLPNVLQELRQELLSGSFQPLPVRRIYIPKANGKQRPLGIPTLRDRIVQRAMLMAMEPIWESNFHPQSHGFRPKRSVHHAVRSLRMQLIDGKDFAAGRWVVEGDLLSYFDTVHHRLLLKAVRKRICDRRFLKLLWQYLKAGHIDAGLFRAASEGVPQGGVVSPILSNIMLNEFDQYLQSCYLNYKVRKKTYRWNSSIKNGFPIAVSQGRQRKPTLSYCRYADDFIIVVNGSKQQAEDIREECRLFLETRLKLTLNMEKTCITHVNEGFVFLGHRFIRKRGSTGRMRVVTTIPREKTKSLLATLSRELSGNENISKSDIADRINRKLIGWANFYQYADYKGKVFNHIDHVVFWKMAHWLARKYRTKIKTLLRRWFRNPCAGKAKNWILRSKSASGEKAVLALERLVGRGFRRPCFQTPTGNPYLLSDKSNARQSSFDDVVMAFSRI